MTVNSYPYLEERDVALRTGSTFAFGPSIPMTPGPCPRSSLSGSRPTASISGSSRCVTRSRMFGFPDIQSGPRSRSGKWT